MPQAFPLLHPGLALVNEAGGNFQAHGTDPREVYASNGLLNVVE